MAAKVDYNGGVLKFVQAIDYAIESVRKYPPENFNKENVEHFIKIYLSQKDAVLNFNLKSGRNAFLKQHTQDAFIYFQEGSGKAVDYFWE